MDLSKIKTIFSGGKNKNDEPGSRGARSPKSGKQAAGSGLARGGKALRGAAGGKGGKGGKGAEGARGGKSGKIAPVSPAKARLERRANDEKIIKNIKIAFTTIIIIAIIGTALAVFMYVYRPTVATVGGTGISQYEFIYQLKNASMNATEYSSVETLGQTAINSAAEAKVQESVAKERGITLSQDDRDEINGQMDYINEMASSGSYGTGTRMSGDEYLRSYLGVSSGEYRKLMESEMMVYNLISQEYENITVPDEDAMDIYEGSISEYNEATVRHILFLYEGQFDDEIPRTKEESQAMAEDAVARINAGEDMAMLVQELSEDTDLTNEGIYTFKSTDSFEPGFLSWTFEAGRQVGDVGICETSYGYHVMRMEGVYTIPFEDVKDDIVYDIKTTQVDAMKQAWSSDPKYQLSINQRVYDSVVQQILG